MLKERLAPPSEGSPHVGYAYLDCAKIEKKIIANSESSRKDSYFKQKKVLGFEFFGLKFSI